MTKVTYGQWKEFRGNQIFKFFRNELPMQQIQIAELLILPKNCIMISTVAQPSEEKIAFCGSVGRQEQKQVERKMLRLI